MWGSCRGAGAFLAVLLSSACQGTEPAADADGEEASSTGGSEDGSSGSSGDAPVDVPEGCGNGIVEPGEACDLGFANAADGACTPACALASCGDGFVGEGEACDEGEANGGPACSEACSIPSRLRWSMTVGGSAHGWDLAVALVPVAERSVIAALYVDDEPVHALIARYDADGTLPWSVTLSSPPLRYYPLSAHLVPAEDDGVLLSIFADEAEVEGSGRVELRRLDASGQTRWRHVVGTSALGRALSGRVTTAGEQVVLTVPFEVDGGEIQTLVTRLDDDGELLSEHMVDESLWRTAGAPGGGFFAHTDARLLAFGADDELAWSVASSSTIAAALVVDAQGRPLLTRRSPAGDRLLEAYTTDGRLRWHALLELRPSALAIGPGSEILVVGTADAEPMGLPTNFDLAVEAFDAEGARQWIERIDGPAHGEDEGRAAAIAGDGAMWAAGGVSVPYEERDAWIGRFEEDPR